MRNVCHAQYLNDTEKKEAMSIYEEWHDKTQYKDDYPTTDILLRVVNAFSITLTQLKRKLLWQVLINHIILYHTISHLVG